MTSFAVDEARRRALDFLLTRIDYEKSVAVPYGEQQYKLDRMRDLLERIGRPDRKYPIVHVAGTKGKGSTSAMIAAALEACGYKCGLFTSPHLERVEERFVVAGRPCEAATFAALVERLRPIVNAMDEELAFRTPPESGPTYFELTTALALLLFADANVDFAVIEVGMGGRLDSTNVCQSDVSVITSISLDHTKQLGDTLAKIAWEKAGIIKPGVPVVSGAAAPEAREVIERVAAERGCRLVQLGRDFCFDYRPPRDLQDGPSYGTVDVELAGAAGDVAHREVELGLFGRHQAANAAVALAALEELRRRGVALPEADLRRGLKALAWPGRVEVVRRRPCVVFDAAHNPASFAALLETLDESFRVRRRILVFATTQEKDAAGMLAAALPKFEHVVLTRYRQSARGVPVEELAAIASSLPWRNWRTADHPGAAWDEVLSLQPASDDLICVAGSFFILPPLRKLVEATFPDPGDQAST